MNRASPAATMMVRKAAAVSPSSDALELDFPLVKNGHQGKSV
jgi:hypothetical protein